MVGFFFVRFFFFFNSALPVKLSHCASLQPGDKHLGSLLASTAPICGPGALKFAQVGRLECWH